MTSEAEKLRKPRLRYTSHGWYRFWLSFESGYRLLNGTRIPDADGFLERHLWVGPFDTCREALQPFTSP
jgi:hypothetical protein